MAFDARLKRGVQADMRKTLKTDVTPTALIVPGLRDHMPDHWQTLLERKLANATSVPRRDHNKLSCALWVDALDRSLAQIGGPVVLVAHSAGCAIVAHWAAQRKPHSIVGALLATPPDFDSPLPQGYPTREALEHNDWLPMPVKPLPFPSIVAASTNDPLCRFERAIELAAHWGSDVVNIGTVGHLNPASGYGDWPRAEAFVRELCAAR
jgi:predicted alpha/beta hydrolase family esterase